MNELMLSDSHQGDQHLFPHTPEQDATQEEFFIQHELAHWTLSALETVIHEADRTGERERYAKTINAYNIVAGETGVIVRQGIKRGFLTPEL